MGKIIGITFLTASFFYLYNKAKQIIKLKQKQALLKQAQMRKQKEYLDKLKSYGAINYYAICLSVDYRVKKNFNKDNKLVINKAVYQKLVQLLSEAELNIRIKQEQNNLVIISEDFASYDYIYDTLLNMLAKLKSEIDKRYQIYMMPSITTDAYTANVDISTIIRNHENIKHCNLINMSCTTNMFLKKYKHLNKNKYMGVPIGEYSIVDSEKANTYELNMVHKDLSNRLESLG